MRVLISQSSRNDAHNLDDLSERWQLRKERDKFSVWIPPSLPAFKDASEVQFFRAELIKIRIGLDTELGIVGKFAKNREELLKWGKHIQTLQIQSKAKLEEFEASNGGNHFTMIKGLMRRNQLVIEGDDSGYTLTFPSIGQSVFIPKEPIGE